MGEWTIVKDEKVLDSALSLAKGVYQENILLGNENLSGSTLKGKARQWGSGYARSRASLFRRMVEAEIPFSEIRGDHNKRILVIG